MRNLESVVKGWIDLVNDEGVGLTEWELGFMESITEQFEERQWLSDNQEECLEKIYANRTR